MRLLDLFCCEGGAAVGYARAGFEVVGVDLEPRFAKRYPFEFHAGDALEYVKEHGHTFDVIHASPPCQHASAGTRASSSRDRYPRLIEPTREALRATGKPFVIENVAGSALLSPLVLCGTELMLSAYDDDGTRLEMWRHRHFESNVLLVGAGGCRHGGLAQQVAGSYGGARRDKDEARNVRHGGYVPSFKVQQRLLGVDWMTEHGMHQCVPPACGAFAKPGELDEVGFFYPSFRDYIRGIEAEAREMGLVACEWGKRPPRKGDAAPGPMCSACTLWDVDS